MRILNTQNISKEEILRELQKPRSKASDVRQPVLDILSKVKKGGDKALFELTKRFDGVALKNLQVTSEEIQGAYGKVDPMLIKELKNAKQNIETFHRSMLRKKEPSIETQNGVQVWREFRPIEKVGLYVPGGTAAYPSTVLMLGVPAQVAGCKEVVMCTPPLEHGTINPAILVAADLCGIQKIFKVGGAQAIGAMAYGTQTIPKVYKLFGPGNAYVSTAKLLVYGEVDIDMPAGPSEVAVLADEEADANWVGADLLSQLEHGTDSQALLVTFSEAFAKRVIRDMKEQMKACSRRNIIQESFEKSFAVVVKNEDEACEILNEYASEHLEIICAHEERILEKINNVGSVFLGKYTPEPLGDYATGANHTLPTSGFAKMFGPLSTDSFGKMIQVQKVSREGLNGLAKTVTTIATCEELDAHVRAITIRTLTKIS